MPVGQPRHRERDNTGCLDRVRLALDGDSLKLFGLKLDVLTFADFVALDDVG